MRIVSLAVIIGCLLLLGMSMPCRAQSEETRGGPPPLPPEMMKSRPSVSESAPDSSGGGGAPVISPSNAQEVPIEKPPLSNLSKYTKTGGVALPPGAEALPTQSTTSATVTLIVKDLPIEQVLDRLRKAVGVVVRSKGKTAGTKLSLKEVNKNVEDVLDNIAKPNKWKWVKRTDGSYDLYDQETFVSEVLSQQVQRKVFPLKFIEAADLSKVIEPVLTPDLGSASADERANSLIVTDLPDKLALIESIIREYDVQLYTHVFEITNAETQEIADRLDKLKSKYSEIHVDAVNHTIIVKDETLEKIKVMEQMVELLDRDQEIRIYNLANIGSDGKDAEDLMQKFIQPVITKDAILEFNAPNSLLYVKDVRSVHKKILDILKQVDRPRRQVLIEGELMSVSTAYSNSFGVSWTFGNSLLDAINTNKIDAPTGVTANDTVKNQLAGFPYGTASSSGLAVTAMTNSVRAEMSALLSDARTRLLMKPSIILSNHKEGTINVTTQYPVLNTYYNNSSTNSSSTYQTTSQSYIDSGLIVTIIPAISNRGLVEMELSIENSSADPVTIKSGGSDNTAYTKKNQKASTIMIVPSGQTRAISGLITDNSTNDSNGVPILAQIPYLGALFGKKANGKNMSNLMFFITPTILETKASNDLIVEAVNAPARVSMLEEQGVVTPPEKVNEIPEQLKPYLEQIRPATVPYMKDDHSTTATATIMPNNDSTPTTATAASVPMVPSDDTIPATPTASASPTSPIPAVSSVQAMNQQKLAAKKILTSEPVKTVLADSQSDVVKVGGDLETKTGKLGPSGAFGAAGGKASAVSSRGSVSSSGSTGRTKASKSAVSGSQSKRSQRSSSRLAPSNETRY